MLKLKYSDLFFYTLVTFAFIKVFNIVITLCVEGIDPETYHDLTQILFSMFIYATTPLFNLRAFDRIPYRVLQLLHLILFIGFISLYIFISGLFLPIHETALGRTIFFCTLLYIVMSVLIEIIEHQRVRYYNKLIKMAENPIGR